MPAANHTTSTKDTEIVMLALADPEWLQEARDFIEQGEFYVDPPATPEDICAWENACGVSLPLEYRHFLQRIGNGVWDCEEKSLIYVAGIPTAAELAAQQADLLAEETKRINTEFPLEEWCSYGFLPDEMGYEYDAEKSRNFDSKVAEILQQLTSGTWRIRGQENHEEWCVLVVTGPQRGQIWRSDEQHHPDYSCGVDLLSAGTFSEWVSDINSFA